MICTIFGLPKSGFVLSNIAENEYFADDRSEWIPMISWFLRGNQIGQKRSEKPENWMIDPQNLEDQLESRSEALDSRLDLT